MNICIIGAGYVGLVTGAVFADMGNVVFCVDSDPRKIDKLNSGRMTVYEPGLEEMVERNCLNHRLSFSTDAGCGVDRSDVVFIAVGSSPGSDGHADLSAVKDAAKEIARNLNRYKLVVNKSTVPVGTGDLVREIIECNKIRPEIGFDVVSNPEFLREGSAINDTLYPDRIVIGARNREAAMKVLELYAPLERPMIITDVCSAEMIKHASNAFLAARISFINAIANICEEVQADVSEVARGMGYDRRIGMDFLNAGLGYGGSCFGKDTKCLIATAELLGCDLKLLKEVVEINTEQPKRLISKMKSALGTLEGRTVGVLGLAFKPNTDDMRDAKSLEVIGYLVDEGVRVKAYDPIAVDNARGLLPEIEYSGDAYGAVADADAVVVVTEWNEFKLLDLIRVKGNHETADNI